MTYNLSPETKIDEYEVALKSYLKIGEYLRDYIKSLGKNSLKIAIECYPGVDNNEVKKELIDLLNVDKVWFADEFAMEPIEVNQKIADTITDDRVRGVMSHYEVKDFYPNAESIQKEIKQSDGTILAYGTGAVILMPDADVTIYCDLARWEIQLRQRQGLSNWRQDNASEEPLKKFKRGFFFEWRMADRLKKEILPEADFLLDTNIKNDPRLVKGKDLINGLLKLTKMPYRTVPYFDASVWGGNWMRERFDLPDNGENYGWAFDGVPEENSLYLTFGNVRIEIPAMDLMLLYPKEILGDRNFSRFGAEFPIRFDYLDTMGGGNLSLQVHPLTEYIKDKYGMTYTQDESYYILDARDDSSIYLGFKDNVNKEQFEKDIIKAQTGKEKFDDEKYINHASVKKHDHYLIPAGTIHCGGRNTVVLEVSATPYIFTFKMWDWGRVGLDGIPRPLHIKEGLDNVQYDRTATWVKENLTNQITVLKDDGHERLERTGLAREFEFIETRRHWIKDAVEVESQNGVNMLNLVEGESALIESTDNTFEPFRVDYGETFIVPARVKKYIIRNNSLNGGEIGVLQAFVKN